MQTNGEQRARPEHPPLARDAQGNLLEVPNGTAAWRVCRQTTGRPRAIVGPDKEPLRFPLDVTNEELAELCGPDVYRVYALDEVGKVLDFVTTVDVSRESREPRNGLGMDTVLPSLRTPPPATSDLRFALEAMAQMMRVNSEALRAVTASQADWVKSIAATRGFFRNAFVPVPEGVREVDDDDQDDDDDQPRSKTIYDVLAPIAEHWAPSVKPLVSMLTSGAAGARNGSPSIPGADEVGASDSQLAARPKWELRDLIDLNYAATKAKAKKAQADVAARKETLLARLSSDPKLLSHFAAIKALLQPAEAAQILALVEGLDVNEHEWLIDQVSALSPADAAALLRTALAELKESKKPTDATT